MALTLMLFLVIFIEGYVVLSTELLAIRLMIPFTGSGTDTISIIIAAVLMPLAFGYFSGGRFKPKRKDGRPAFTVRRKLVHNLTVSGIFLTLGLSYSFLEWASQELHFRWGLTDRILITSIYSLVFLTIPVYLLGQTVPLVSNYFSSKRLSLIAGRMLFFSTLGSFMGAVFCTLVLMSFLGVHFTVSITIGCIAFLVLLLSKKKISLDSIVAVSCFIIALYLNSGVMMDKYDIVANNRYHTIQVKEITGYEDALILKMNGNNSSGIYTDSPNPYFPYAKFVDKRFIDPLKWAPETKKILVVGAGGFTLGRTDNKNEYIFLDLDAELLETVEEHFLKEKLGANKKFEPVPARAYLNQTEEKFDMIVLDLFRGKTNTPEHLVTMEFFQQVKDALKPGGIMVGNYLISPTFGDDFTTNLDNTMRHVFKNMNRQIVNEYDAWNAGGKWINVIYSYHHNPEAPDTIYTDDKNASHFDKPSSFE